MVSSDGHTEGYRRSNMFPDDLEVSHLSPPGVIPQSLPTEVWAMPTSSVACVQIASVLRRLLDTTIPRLRQKHPNSWMIAHVRISTIFRLNLHLGSRGLPFINSMTGDALRAGKSEHDRELPVTLIARYHPHSWQLTSIYFDAPSWSMGTVQFAVNTGNTTLKFFSQHAFFTL